MKKNSILGAVREHFNSSRTTRLREQHDDAVRHLHRLEADRVFLTKMRDFYVDKKVKLVPDDQWVEFYEVRQKQHDFDIEIEVVNRKIEEQQARVEARCAALKAHHEVC